jgi:hypothetical protein
VLDHVEDKSTEPLLEVSDIESKFLFVIKQRADAGVCFHNSNNQISNS